MKKTLTFTLLAAMTTCSMAFAAPQNKDTPADTIHPNIHSKVGQGDGTNANPNGANTNGGNIPYRAFQRALNSGKHFR